VKPQLVDKNIRETFTALTDTSGHFLKLQSVIARYRIVINWNSLPERVASAPSLNRFKNRYDKRCNVLILPFTL